MSEVGPDLEAEANKAGKLSKIKEASKKAVKVASVTGRIALAAGRFAIGPGDEIAAAVLPTLATQAVEERAAVLPSQDQLIVMKRAKNNPDGNKPPQPPNRQQRRAQKFKRNLPLGDNQQIVVNTQSAPELIHQNTPQTTPLRR